MDNYLAHILVVDDDEGIRSLVKKYLNENNYLITTAESAEDASEKVQKELNNNDVEVLSGRENLLRISKDKKIK